ncbi:SBBP repeat-containing protein [Emticicia sp. C21]|uniref:SBBP repeat-containing protein n=1 Tax=Emticicia sp. C21 TaxID=2302915 RepID=UPI000E3430B7|nr:SBBP repeat-containing protein [Emticicia sp. C21]RFS16975.1 hypothetical protein D0T08_09875 [Emticicia sp. C21]
MKTNFFFNLTIRSIATVLLWLVLFLSANTVFSQHVTILPSGITPKQSGAIPRLSYESIMALPNPQDGDEAYDITFHCKRLYCKNRWVKILSNIDLANPSTLIWQIGGAKNDWGSGLATDASGNVYVGGYFQESAMFGNTEVTGNGVDLTTLFIAKYASAGQLLWVQKIAYCFSAEFLDLVLDANGNIFVTGYFHNTITFGANTLTSSGQKDVFIAKYSNNGTLQWVQRAGGTGDDEGKSLGVDSNGNLYITGVINGNVTFGGNSYLSSGNSVFIVKFDANGDLLWLRRGICSNGIASHSIVVDTNGKITVIGSFLGTVTFDFDTYTSSGNTDVFLAQYSSNGNLTWAKRLGGSSTDYGTDIALDSENNLVISGSFQGSAGFDNFGLTSSGGSDIFLVKFTSSGTVQWVRKDGGTSNELCHSMAIDVNGNIYITGEFLKPSVFGGTTLYGKAYAGMFVAKYTPDSEVQWAKEMGGNNLEAPFEMVADTKGNVYSMGYFGGMFTCDNATLNTKGVNDIFIVRFTD